MGSMTPRRQSKAMTPRISRSQSLGSLSGLHQEVHQEMNDLIKELTSEMSTTKLRQLKDVVEAHERVQAPKQRAADPAPEPKAAAPALKPRVVARAVTLPAPTQKAPEPVANVKRFQDLRDHFADRKVLSEIMGSHTSDKQIVIRTVEEPKCKCTCNSSSSSCFGSNFLMLLVGAAAGYAGMR